MTDNETTREKTFSEELPYFKERIKEVFDNYDNPNGNEDPLYIAVLRDSKRIVRKAEEEITHLQAEIERLQENRDELWEIHCRDTERSFVRMNEIDILKEELKTVKSEAYKECIEKVKEKNRSVGILRQGDLDNLVKEMVGDNND